jgi:hypothetical protein
MGNGRVSAGISIDRAEQKGAEKQSARILPTPSSPRQTHRQEGVDARADARA